MKAYDDETQFFIKHAFLLFPELSTQISHNITTSDCSSCYYAMFWWENLNPGIHTGITVTAKHF